MELIHESTSTNYDGTIDVSVFIRNKVTKRYIYTLTSQYEVRKFYNYYARKHYGKALQTLKKGDIRVA
jgi:hypothetical protein